MKKEELSEGCFVHWVADRHFKAWDVYGQVVRFDEENVTILTFDSFIENTISIDNEAFIEEVKLTDKETVLMSLLKKKIDLSHEKEHEILRQAGIIKSFERRISKTAETIEKIINL